MPRQTKVFRVFVSSTFSDFKAERNALQQNTFRKLREYCQANNAEFQAIDLRWGVSEEAALDQQAINICFQEIKRCQKISPQLNFIALLGERYGARPLPSQIETLEFESILKKTPKDQQDELLEWYQKDDNAVPPEYCLKPRHRETDLHQTASENQTSPKTKAQHWNEPYLHNLLANAAREVFPNTDDPRRQKYEESATHQEIRQGILEAPDAQNHVFCYFRTIHDLPENEQAIAYRDFRDHTIDREAQQRLASLKAQLNTKLTSDHIYEYHSQWHTNHPETELDAFCARIETDLKGIIDQELAKFQQTSTLEGEIEAQTEFIQQRTQHFQGREDILKRIQDYLNNRDNHPFILSGVSGSGKTALMGRVAELIAGRQELEITQILISRYIGATPASSHIRYLLESINQELALAYHDERPVPHNFIELTEDFLKRIQQASPQQPLIITLDALDQLSRSDNPQSLYWLPRELPDHVKIIVSTLESEGSEGDCYRILQKRTPLVNLAQVGFLEKEQGEQLLDVWLQNVNRRLQDTQRIEVLNHFANNAIPLYMKLVFEEVRRWKSYDTKSILGTNTPDLIGNLLNRLEEERSHGRIMTNFTLAYLATGRYGLTEEELTDILSSDETVLADFNHRKSPASPIVNRLPTLIWSRLYADLESYLTERWADHAIVISFYHRQVWEVVAQRYLNESRQIYINQKIAAYFKTKTDPGHDQTWNGNYLRGFRELPYHFHQYAKLSQDAQPLYQLADNEQFKNRQYELFHQLELNVDLVKYAVDVAAKNCDIIKLNHYVMLRLDITTIFLNKNLNKLIAIIEDHTQHIPLQEVINYIPDVALRCFAFVFAAWNLSGNKGKSEYIRHYIRSAVDTSIVMPIGQGLVFLEMIKDLFCAGYDEASLLLPVLSHCPFRQMYIKAWRNETGRLKIFYNQLIRIWELSPELPASDSEYYSLLQEIKALRKNCKDSSTFEDRILLSYGKTQSISETYFLIALDHIHSGSFEWAQKYMQKGIFHACPFPSPAIRTIIALAEGYQRSGNIDAMKEKIAEIQSMIRSSRRMGINEEFRNDAFDDFETPLKNRIDDEKYLIGDRFATSSNSKENDLIDRFTKAKRLLVEGKVSFAIIILQQIELELPTLKDDDTTNAIILATYYMARCCKVETLIQQCHVRLEKVNLFPESIYDPYGNSQPTTDIAKILNEADPRCMAIVSYCLRFEGFSRQLCELVNILNEIGPKSEVLDSVLAQLIRMNDIHSDDLRTINDEIFGTTVKGMKYPRGFGRYVIPDFMLGDIWPGMISGAIGINEAIANHQLLLLSLVYVVGSLIGSFADLGIWRVIGLWKNPEMSNRTLINKPLAFIIPWLLLFAFGFNLTIVTNGEFIFGVSITVNIYMFTFQIISRRFKGRLGPMTKTSIIQGTLIAIIISLLGGCLSFGTNLIPAQVRAGSFFGAIIVFGFAINRLLKRIAILKFYRTQRKNSQTTLIGAE